MLDGSQVALAPHRVALTSHAWDARTLWESSARHLNGATTSGTPLVLELGEAAAKLLPTWTPSSLSALRVNLTRVYVSPDTRFGPYFDERRPLARLVR